MMTLLTYLCFACLSALLRPQFSSSLGNVLLLKSDSSNGAKYSRNILWGQDRRWLSRWDNRSTQLSLAYPILLVYFTKKGQLCFTPVAPLMPLLQVCWQQTLLNIWNFHFHYYHKVREKLSLQHVLHLIRTVREALQNKTSRPTRWSMRVVSVFSFDFQNDNEYALFPKGQLVL